MQLTEVQIQQLFAFTQAHHVKYYDVQIELVDHLASRIEEATAQNANLSFDDALQNVFKEFGIFGFGKIVQKKEEEMRKQYKRMAWREFKTYFTIPRIILTILITLITTYACNLIGSKLTYLFFMIIGFGTVLIQLIMDRNFKSKKPLLMLGSNKAYYYNPYNIIGINLLFNINTIIHTITGDKVNIYNYSFIVVPFMTVVSICILCGFSIGKRIKEKAIQQYPEAFAS
jgi:hypothetical protein